MIRTVAVLAAFGLVAAACGGDDDDDAGDAADTTDAPAGDDGDDGDSGDDGDDGDDGFDLGGRTITIAVENAYLPFNYLDPETGEPTGWDYDTIEVICELLNCVPEYKTFSWEPMIQAVADGQFDMAADGITINDERAEIVDFSNGYIAVEQRLLVALDSDITGAQDIIDSGCSVVSQVGTTNLATAQETFGEDNVVALEDFGFVVQSVIAGDNCAAVIDETAGVGYVGANADDVKLVGDSLSSDELGFIFPKGSDLVEPINYALDTMKADGSLASISSVYFGDAFTISYDDIDFPDCGPEEGCPDEGDDGDDAAPMECVATVGFHGPITGPVAFIGEVQLNWFKYALDTFNADMGYDIQMVEGDNQFDTAQAATVAAQFLDNGDMVASVGPAGSDQVAAAGAVYEAGDSDFTFISPSSTRVGIASEYSGMFRTVPTDADQAPTTADHMVAQGAGKVFMIDDQSSYSTGLADGVQGALEDAGVDVTRESVSQDITDFSALVSTIDDDTDFVYLPWQVAANGQILANQMAEQGKDIAIFGSDGMDSDDFSVPGSIIAGFAPDIAGVEGSVSILEGFLAEYDSTNTFGPPVYAAAYVIFEAISRVCDAGETPNRANVKAEVQATDQSDTILGSPISFTADGDLVEGQFFLFEIQDDGSKTLIS
jgi:ABC-type amino acid transport substrate-binding protein